VSLFRATYLVFLVTSVLGLCTNGAILISTRDFVHVIEQEIDAGNALPGSVLFSAGQVAAYAVLGLVLAVQWYRLRGAVKQGLGRPIYERDFPILGEFVGTLLEARRLGVKKVRFWCGTDRKASLARVIEYPSGTLHIVLQYKLLTMLSARPSFALGVLWHEIGHFVQWDSKFGYMNIVLAQQFYNLILSISVVAGIGGLIYVVPDLLIDGIAFQDLWLSGLVILLVLLPLAFLMLLVSAYRYGLEFNADRLAVISGYDPSAGASVGSSRWPSISHPSEAMRRKVIQQMVRERDHNASSPQQGIVEETTHHAVRVGPPKGRLVGVLVPLAAAGWFVVTLTVFSFLAFFASEEKSSALWKRMSDAGPLRAALALRIGPEPRAALFGYLVKSTYKRDETLPSWQVADALKALGWQDLEGGKPKLQSWPGYRFSRMSDNRIVVLRAGTSTYHRDEIVEALRAADFQSSWLWSWLL
jgi:hypothetical protein